MKMTEEKKLFPAQEKSELVLDIIRRHWFVYLPFLFLATVMLIPIMIGVYLWFNGTVVIAPGWENIIILATSIYLLLIQALMIYGFVDYYLDVYIVTDRRIVDISQNGFFKRSISELNLRQIQDVSANVSGFASTLLHFGDVHIQTAAERPNFSFLGVPHPYEVSKKILDLHEAYLQRIERKGRGVGNGKNGKGDPSDLLTDSVNKTLTEQWFEESSEVCYSDETCRQKVLEGINKHLEEASLMNKDKAEEKEGELKEGKEVDL